MKKLGLLVVLAVALFGFGAWSLGAAYQGFEGAVFVNIAKGMSTRQMAALLEEKGVVRNGWQFLAARALRPGAILQAGEYQFKHADSAQGVFSRIAAGDVFYYEVTIPEGRNILEIAKLVHESLEFISEEAFLKAASDPKLIGDLDSGAKTLEGYLFPSTYRVTSSATAEALCRQMVEQFRHVWGQLGENQPAVTVVTMASLIEEEAKLGREREVVSSVFWNRLKKGMKLDCDPTVVYAALLENKYRGTIYQSDLRRDHPYNTYRRAGLPPGPISNPGMASIKAALNPAVTNYLFFVASASGDGSHRFSATIEEHSQAVGSYRNANGKEKASAAVGRRKKAN